MLFFFLFSIFLLGCQNNEDKIQEAKKLNGLNLDHIIQNLVLDQKATFSAPDPMMVQKAFEPCKLNSSKKFIFEANCIVYENENYLVNDNIDQNFNLNVIVQGSRSMIDYVQFNATLPNRIHQALSGKNYQKEKLSCEGIGSWEINKISLSGKKDFNIAIDKSFGSGGEWGTLRIYLNGFDLERICDDLVYELLPGDDEFAVPQTITEELEKPIIKNENKSNNALLEIKKLGQIDVLELAECDTAFEFGVDGLPYEARLLNLYLSARMAIDYYIYNRMPRNLNEELYIGLKNEFRIKNGISAANNEVSKKVVPVIQKCFKRFSPLLRNMIIEGKLDKGAFERIPFNSKAKSSFSIPSVDDISTLEGGGVLGEVQSSSPEQKTASNANQHSVAQSKYAGASALQDPSSEAFRSLNPLERFFISKEKSHWYEIQDNGGLKGTFFGLSIFSVANEGKKMFLDTKLAPASIRKWANALCGIDEKDWKIVRAASFTSGKAEGLYCDADYQPLSNSQQTWSVSLVGPKTLPDRTKIKNLSTPKSNQTTVPSTSVNSAGAQGGGMPSMESGRYREFCEEKWTKKGVVDQGMADYCVEGETRGFHKAVDIISKFSDQKWIEKVTKHAVDKWTKKGMRQDSGVAYTLKKITDGFEEIEIASQRSDFDQKKLDKCYQQWQIKFDMVWYCYKK